MTGRLFDFDSRGGYRLSGRLEAPETTPRGWAIFAHCFTCGKDSVAAARVTKALSRAGIGVLRFDFAGMGKSVDGDVDTNFAADVGDLEAAAAAMRDAGMPPSLLIGHSLGGTAAIAAAVNLPEIAAVATISAPADLPHILKHFAPEDIERVKREGEAEILISGRPFVVRRSFLDELERHNVEKLASELRRPLLIMHAPRDELVGVEHASRLFLAAKHPKSFVSLDTADHLLSAADDANYAAAIVATWAARYMPTLIPDLPQVEPAQGVSASETGAGKLQLLIKSGAHQIIADEPRDVGGLGSGMSPYELVSAGLAACSVMTMRLYADRKGFPLHRARTTVKHEKIAGMMPADRFIRVITLEGPLDAEQRQRIAAIADRCPVDLTLIRGSDVQTTLEAAPDVMGTRQDT